MEGHWLRGKLRKKKTKYMVTSRHQNVGLIQNQNIVIGNLSFENVEIFRYLAVTVTNTKRHSRRN